MGETHDKLARLMRAKPDVLEDLERKMNRLTGQEGVFDDIVRQIEITADRTLVGLGLSRTDDAELVRSAMAERVTHLDSHLYQLLGSPDLTDPVEASRKLWDVVSKVFVPPKGLFIKHSVAIRMLEKYPPHNLLEHFGYANIEELLEKEGFASVMASLRFSQTEQWMHEFFDIAYSDLTADDFEERDVEHIVLDRKWVTVAEKYLKKKYHNVSHLKEFGVIFIVPIDLQIPGATLRLFTLILHYLHEVPFYAGLFRRHMQEKDFSHVFKSLLRGDVPTGPAPNHGKITWRVVQRYLAKDNMDDFRLFEPHVNPEADHWWRAEEDLGRLSRILGRDRGGLDLGWWSGLDFIGQEFLNAQTGKQELISFDLIDLLMSLVRNSGNPYLYHQQEALWNKIFIEYMGRERMQGYIEENLVSGFIDLSA
jgi:hypothetical protein